MCGCRLQEPGQGPPVKGHWQTCQRGEGHWTVPHRGRPSEIKAEAIAEANKITSDCYRSRSKANAVTSRGRCRAALAALRTDAATAEGAVRLGV